MISILAFVGAALLLFFVFHAFRLTIYEKYINPRIDTSPSKLCKLAILITGCDSGFGEQSALTFVSMGFTVFATCLTKTGKDNLMSKWTKYSENDGSSPRLHTLEHDVTKMADNERIVAYIEDTISKCNLRLWGVINNAGVMRTGEIELLKYDDFYDSIRVNVLGPIALTKLLIHLLRRTEHSRIINICSASVLAPMYGYGAYVTSKCALEAFSTVLRAELSHIWKVHVACILPGAFATNLLSADQMYAFYHRRVDQLSDSVLSDYGKKYFEDSSSKCVLGTKYAAGKDITPVINAVLDAMLRVSPYKRYIVRWDGWALYLFSYCPQWLREILASGPLRPLTSPAALKGHTQHRKLHFVS